jgi:hypothetical protein
MPQVDQRRVLEFLQAFAKIAQLANQIIERYHDDDLVRQMNDALAALARSDTNPIHD